MSVKCRVQMKDRVLPVGGSVRGAEAHERTGTCPECSTPGVMLSIVGGFVRAHTVSSVALPENNPSTAVVVPERRAHKHASSKVGKGLSEPVTGLTDTGVRIGDPRAAEQRRVASIEGAAGIGVVQVPRKYDTGKKLKSGAPRMSTRLTDVPATEANVREALDYWRLKRITERTPDSVRRKQASMVSLLSRRLEAIMSAQEVRYDVAQHVLTTVTVPVGEQLALSAAPDAAQGHRGPTLVRGRDTAPRLREGGASCTGMDAARLRDPELTPLEPTDMRQVRVGPKGAQRVVGVEPRRTTTNESPQGRERFDRKITDVPEPPKKRTAAERNRYRKAQRLARKLAGNS